MVNVEIPDLLDGEEITTSIDPVATQHDGVTYRVTNRKNPEGVITIRNQTQLEDILGTDLEIPDNESRTIAIDNSLTLSKPIKLGLNSILNIFGSATNNTITYTGVGALFQNTLAANLIAELEINNLTLVGDTTNDTFDIIGSPQSSVTCDEVIFQNFNFVGTIDTGAALFTGCSMRFITQGIVLKNQNVARIDRFSIGQPVANGMTGITFIPGVTLMEVTIDTFRAIQFAAGNTLLFIDPNSPVGSTYSIINSSSGPGDFYQLGADIAINSVADNGSGDARFTTAAAHGLVVGQAVVLDEFVTETTYNDTFIVTAIPTTTTFDVEEAFTATDTGNMNKSSLDSTSVLVSAENNQGSPDSMSQAEARTGATLEVDGSGGVDVPIQDLTPAPGDWIEDPTTEEFTVDTSTGVTTYNGIKDKTFLIQYQLTAIPSSGPAQILDFDVHINGIIQTKATTTIDTSSATKTTYIGGLFVLSTGDTVQLFKENLTNTNNTDVSVATVLITSS